MTGNSVNEDVYLSVNIDKAVAGDDKIDIVNAEGIDIDDSMEKEETDSV